MRGLPIHTLVRLLTFNVLIAAVLVNCFASALTDSNPPPMVFAVISDTHIGYRAEDEQDEEQIPLQNTRAFYNFAWAMDHVNNVLPDFLLIPGDLVHSGDWGHEDQYSPFMKIARRCKVPVLYVMGNHDGESFDIAAHNRQRQLFTEHTGSPPWYHREIRGWHLIVLDSSRNGRGGRGGWGIVDPEQIQWLKAELATIGPTEPILLVEHHPFNRPQAQAGDLVNSAEVLDAFQGHYLTYTITGHFHENLHDRDARGIHHFVTGATCGQPAGTDIGYRLFSTIGRDLWTAWIPKSASSGPLLTLISETGGPGNLMRDWEVRAAQAEPPSTTLCLRIEYQGGPIRVIARAEQQATTLCKLPPVPTVTTAFLPLGGEQLSGLPTAKGLDIRFALRQTSSLARLRVYGTTVEWRHYRLKRSG